jgi:hypothetical protein
MQEALQGVSANPATLPAQPVPSPYAAAIGDLDNTPSHPYYMTSGHHQSPGNGHNVLATPFRALQNTREPLWGNPYAAPSTDSYTIPPVLDSISSINTNPVLLSLSRNPHSVPETSLSSLLPFGSSAAVPFSSPPASRSVSSTCESRYLAIGRQLSVVPDQWECQSCHSASTDGTEETGSLCLKNCSGLPELGQHYLTAHAMQDLNDLVLGRPLWIFKCNSCRHLNPSDAPCIRPSDPHTERWYYYEVTRVPTSPSPTHGYGQSGRPGKGGGHGPGPGSSSGYGYGDAGLGGMSQRLGRGRDIGHGSGSNAGGSLYRQCSSEADGPTVLHHRTDPGRAEPKSTMYCTGLSMGWASSFLGAWIDGATRARASSTRRRVVCKRSDSRGSISRAKGSTNRLNFHANQSPMPSLSLAVVPVSSLTVPPCMFHILAKADSLWGVWVRHYVAISSVVLLSFWVVVLNCWMLERFRSDLPPQSRNVTVRRIGPSSVMLGLLGLR